MITGKTSTGFEFKLDEDLKDSFEFLRCVRKTQSSDQAEVLNGTYDLVALMLGGEAEVDRLVDHVKSVNKASYAKIDAITAEVKEMIEAFNDLKN